jgi:hypothetical protein
MIELAILMLVLVTVVVSEVIAHRRDAAARASASRRCRYAALGLGVLGAAATWAVTTDNERTAPRVWAALVPLADAMKERGLAPRAPGGCLGF